MDPQLRPISRLVQERRYAEARPMLQAYLRAHPDAAYAWYLLSFAARTPAGKRQAIRKAAQLAPENTKYTARLNRLGARPRRSRTLPLVLGGLALVGLLAIGFMLLRPSASPDDSALPTLAALSSVTPAENTQVVAVASSTAIITASPTEKEEPTQTASTISTLAPTQTASVEAPTTEENPLPTATEIAMSLVRPTLPSATAQVLAALPTVTTPPPPTVFQPGAPSSTPSNTPAPTNTSRPGAPTVTPGGDAGVPLSTPLDIGTGEMRVVAVTRPGSSLIAELGGSAANPPPGQEWVVIEALVICSGSDNCAPDLSGIRVIGASGVPYAPAPDFSMPQLFGPGGYAVGQVWGYMGFTVPTSETALRLVLTQNGQTYIFALS